MPVVLDMDPGVDDALALMLALHSPELDVLGVCTVNGNVPLETATNNALAILSMLGKPDLPVYRGSEKPLKREPVHAREIHGIGGLGDTKLPLPTAGPLGSATKFLADILEDRPGEITVIAVGPLTNLATVEQECPGLLQKAKVLVIMGGAIHEPGNVSPSVEFNFFADPDAARLVVRSGASLVLVPLDATHRACIGRSELRSWLTERSTIEASFVRLSMAPALSYTERVFGEASFCLHDPMAVGFTVNPSLFQISKSIVDVEVEGALASGQVVADFRPFVDDGLRKGVPVSWISDVKVEAFKSMFKGRVLPVEKHKAAGHEKVG
jgi:purine nucleosidase